MPSKRRLAQLHNARLAREKTKKREVDQSIPTAQPHDEPFCTDASDSDDLNNPESVIWFWNMSANESESESDEGGTSR